MAILTNEQMLNLRRTRYRIRFEINEEAPDDALFHLVDKKLEEFIRDLEFTVLGNISKDEMVIKQLDVTPDEMRYSNSYVYGFRWDPEERGNTNIRLFPFAKVITIPNLRYDYQVPKPSKVKFWTPDLPFPDYEPLDLDVYRLDGWDTEKKHWIFRKKD